MFDFEKLDVYKKSKLFNKEIRKLILSIKGLDLPTRNQVHRRSLSVLLNISEGSGRFTRPDKRNFFVIARGSLFECIAVLDFLKDEDTIDDNQFNHLYALAEEISKMLFSMIRKLE